MASPLIRRQLLALSGSTLTAGLVGCTEYLTAHTDSCTKPEDPPVDVDPLEVSISNGRQRSWTLTLEIQQANEVEADNTDSDTISDTVIWEPGTYELKAELDNGETAKNTREVDEDTPREVILIPPDQDLNMGPETLLGSRE